MRPPRVVAIDVARAVAIIGMIAAHTGAAEELRWTDPSTWEALAHGRSSILFAVVAGISLALLTRGVAPGRPGVDAEAIRTARLRLLGRAGVIVAIGLVLELVSTRIAVILTVYGAVFLLVIPFLRWSRPRLLAGAAVLGLVSALGLPLLRVAATTGGGQGVTFVFDGMYALLEWLAFALVGLAIGRGELRSARLAVTLVLAGTVAAFAGYGLGAASASWAATGGAAEGDLGAAGEPPNVVPPGAIPERETVCEDYGDGSYSCYRVGTALEDEDGDAATAEADVPAEPGLGTRLHETVLDRLAADPHSGGVGELVGSGGFAVAVVGALLLLVRVLRGAVLPLAAMGSMPLSVYALHVLTYEATWRTHPDLVGRGFWATSVLSLAALATAWALTLGKGPLERLVAHVADRTAHPRV